MTEEITNGIDTLRRRAVVCVATPGVARALARDIAGLSLEDIQAFGAGKRTLKPEVLQALAKELFNAKLNDDGLLQSLNTAEVKPMCANYQSFVDPRSHPFYHPPRDRNAPLLAPQPVTPKPQAVKRRPGWLGGFF